MDKGQKFKAFSKPGFSLKQRTFHFDGEDNDFVICREKTKIGRQIHLFKTQWDFYPKNNGQ